MNKNPSVSKSLELEEHLNIESIKELTAFMKSQGVEEFTFEQLSVKFSSKSIVEEIDLSNPDSKLDEENEEVLFHSSD